MEKTRCYLMNKNEVILEFAYRNENDGNLIVDEVVEYSRALPVGLDEGNLKSWIQARRAPKHRQHIKALLERYGCETLDGFIRLTHALSLNDTFWVKPVESKLNWDDVSLYQNPFDEAIARIAFEGGYGGSSFSVTSPEFSTDGAYAKCWIREKDDIYLIKAGSKDGVEPYSEFYASQIADVLCKSSVKYDIVVYRNTISAKCSIFTGEDLGFVPIWKEVRSSSYNELLQYYRSIGSEDDFRRIIVLDALILNIDRHTGNHGILIDNDTQQVVSMAPVFDHNRSLLYNMKDFELKYYESLVYDLEPKIGENFIEVARAALTPEIIQDLQDLHGFRFIMHDKYNLPDERVELLERIINQQIEKILK